MICKWGVSLASAALVFGQGAWMNPPKPGQLPAGVTHKTYRSRSMNTDIGYLVYLPPDYASSGARRYPVIYNLHGAGGNELHGFEEARLLDHGIRSGKWPPMIMMFPNGGQRTHYKDSADGKTLAETTVIRELIPHVDATYRTIAERKGRAIEGFSMGGRGSTRLAMKYPEMFTSLFNQAGNVMHLAEGPLNEYLGSDRARYVENDAYRLLTRNLARIKGQLRIQIWCGTQDPDHIATIRDFHKALLDAGVDHTYMEIEDLAHKRTEMVKRYEAVWFDYHVESFRRAGAF
jgi:enterochelin esterase-like enzyme